MHEIEESIVHGESEIALDRVLEKAAKQEGDKQKGLFHLPNRLLPY